MAQKKNFPLRLDPKLYEILERWSADEFRSVNAHIEFLLREAAAKAGRLPNRQPPPIPAPQDDITKTSIEVPSRMSDRE